MAGSNGSSSYEDLFGEYDGKIDTNKEFKLFENALSSEGGKEDLIHACEEDSQKVVNAFDSVKLDAKVQEAKGVEKKNKSSKKTMKPEVQEAYLVLGMMKSGKQGTYQELLINAETEVTLESTKQNLMNKINSNADWDEGQKQSARNLIEDLFAECDTIEEFERRSGTRLATLEKTDNIGDFFRDLPKTAYEIGKQISKDTLSLMEQVGIALNEIYEFCKHAIEEGKLKINELVDRCKEKGIAMVDITKTICELGKLQFSLYINFLKETGEDITEALNAAREWTGKQRNNFVDFCGGMIDDIKEFGIMLVEKGELVWNSFLETFINDIEFIKDLSKTLIEKGLIKIGEFTEWCVGIGEKGKELIVSIIEWNVNLWNDFADLCIEKWEFMKDVFITVATELLQTGKIALKTFAEWCKGAWEVVKDTACLILVGLIKAGKFTTEIVVDTLIIAIGVPMMLVSKLLIAAGKEIYKDAVATAEFIGNLSVVLRGKMKEAGISAAEFMKDFIAQCKELGLMSSEYIADVVKCLREKMKEAGISAADFIKSTYETIKLSLRNAWNQTAEFFKNLGFAIEDIAVTLREASKGTWEGCVNFVVKSYKDFTAALNVLIEKCKMSIDKIGEAIMAAKVKIADFIKYAKEQALITYENISKWCKGMKDKIALFIKTALENVKIKWEELVNYCGGKIDKIASVLKEIYGNTVEGVKKFIELVGKGAIEAGKILLELGIAVPTLVILALKQLGCALKDVAELCVKFAKIGIQALCDALMNAFGATKEMIVKIGESVAAAIKGGANAVRDWVYKQTNDIKEAIRATKEYIANGIKDIAEWMYQKGIVLNDICATICEEFKGNVKEIAKGLKAFADDCKISWNDMIAATAQFLTIDI